MYQKKKKKLEEGKVPPRMPKKPSDDDRSGGVVPPSMPQKPKEDEKDKDKS